MTAADPAVFLADILADPADYSARAAYADWLQERGDPRGEFIAVQLRIASVRCLCRNPDGTWNGACGFCDSNELRRRERELLTLENAVRWTPNSPAFAPCSRVEFRRGFVAHVGLTLADFEAHAAALFRAAPLGSVRLTDVRPWVPPRNPAGSWTLATYSLGNGPDEDASVIPGALEPFMPGDKTISPGGRGVWWGFASEKDAQAADNAACVAYGRRLAGLPALPAEGAARA